MLFTEKDSRYSKYIQFAVEDSMSADLPKLSVLRVELERVHPGMADFIARVATPKYSSAGRSGTVLSIRGTKSFAKYDTIKTLALTVCKEMEKRGDVTHDWKNADIEHITDMMYPQFKYFAINTKVEKLSFTTEAL